MSRVHRRTFTMRANIGGSENRLHERLARRATGVGALHKVNPPGTKAEKRVLKHLGLYHKEPA